MLIKKRDGSNQAFDRNKIKKSILAAFESVEENSISEVDTVTDTIVVCIGTMETAGEACTVAGVQGCTERTLIEYGYHEAAASFMEYRIGRDLARESRLSPDPLALPDYIHQAKYAGWNLEEGRRENFEETVDRVIEMHYTKYANPVFADSGSGFFTGIRPNGLFDKIKDEITGAFRYVYTKGVLPAMRSMQFAGVAMEHNNARMYNCCFTHIDRIEAFPEALFLLLSGCGVGYSVQWQHVDMLDLIMPVSREVTHYHIDDSIEGWASALLVLLRSYTDAESVHFGTYVEFSYSRIRPEGAKLKKSGGLAPGHLGLKRMLEEVRGVLDGAVGRKLRPIEAHDMMCYTARAVLSGGIRRSSMIALFSSHDTEMMYCKSPGVFDPERLNIQRCMANNSCVLDRMSADRSIFDRLIHLAATGYGEPGFVFLDNTEDGINPCGEIILSPRLIGAAYAGFAFCNLVEINAANCSNKADFLLRCDAAAVIATLQAGYTKFPFLAHSSGEIARRDRSIGVGITGIMDNPSVLDWLADGRKRVVSANARVADLLGISTSERACCVKPSGTASLLLGTSSGVHCHHSRRYLRRVTCNRTEVIARAFAAANPHMVEAKPNGDYVLVFPVQARDDALIGVTGREFLKVVLLVLREWCGKRGHNVSCTVPVGDGELKDVIDTIWYNREHLTAMAFAPLDISKRYPFAPLEAVDDAVLEAYWALLIGEYTSVDWLEIGETVDGTDPSSVAACDSGKCLV